MTWSALLYRSSRKKKLPINKPVKIKRYISTIIGGLDYEGVNNKRVAIVMSKATKVCSDCGWRACTCNKTLDEWD